jgi:hypothetical protein
MRHLLLSLAVGLMALVSPAYATDTVVTFSGTGMFSDGTTLTGTMEVDTTAGCVIGTAGCPAGGSGAPGAPVFTTPAYPAETFVLGANPGLSGPDTWGLPLISNPFCCGDLSTQVLFATGGTGTLVGYDGGAITGGQIVQDCGTNGVCNLHSDLMGSFTPETTGTVPEPSTWAMLIAGFAALGLLGYRKTRGALA